MSRSLEEGVLIRLVRSAREVSSGLLTVVGEEAAFSPLPKTTPCRFLQFLTPPSDRLRTCEPKTTESLFSLRLWPLIRDRV